ncbi:hypothetical protein F4677DRAFT_458078 [Hypoxylon crocopeplum]|nr:hypothetical protein F4677DRAFT_458078 [Hypoxylon crocopeplum]
MTLHTVDPEGDVLLTLHNPNAPFAVCDEGWEEDVLSSFPGQPNDIPWPWVPSRSATNSYYGEPIPEPEPKPGPSFESELGVEGEPSIEDEPTVQQTNDSGSHAEPAIADVELTVDGNGTSSPDVPTAVQFRLSSRHLVLASKYFEHILRGPWKEGTPAIPDGCRCVDAEDWDEDAMLILMQVIHGRNHQVPRSVTLEMLARIAVLVDYYKCHEAVTIWSDMWINALRRTLPATCNRDLILWILVALVFEQQSLFNAATKVALEHYPGCLPTLGLPIQGIAVLIDKRREEFLHQVFTHLHRLLGLFRDGKAGCSFECASMSLGALTIQIHAANVPNPQLGSQYPRYSIASTLRLIHNFRSPQCRTRYRYSHDCHLSGLLSQGIKDTVEGLELRDI